jgi:hypothetical protein
VPRWPGWQPGRFTNSAPLRFPWWAGLFLRAASDFQHRNQRLGSTSVDGLPSDGGA